MFPEHRLQIELARILTERLDPACVWWSSIDGSWAPSPWIGQLRRLRGCKAGAPDLLMLHRGRLVAIELKTARGRLTEAQRRQRAELIGAGARWFLCRSIAGVLQALRLARVPLRRVERDPYRFDPAILDHQPQSDPAAPWKRTRRAAAPKGAKGLAYWRARLGGEAVLGQPARARPMGWDWRLRKPRHTIDT